MSSVFLNYQVYEGANEENMEIMSKNRLYINFILTLTIRYDIIYGIIV